MKNYISLRQIEHIFNLIERGGGEIIRNYTVSASSIHRFVEKRDWQLFAQQRKAYIFLNQN